MHSPATVRRCRAMRPPTRSSANTMCSRGAGTLTRTQSTPPPSSTSSCWARHIRCAAGACGVFALRARGVRARVERHMGHPCRQRAPGAAAGRGALAWRWLAAAVVGWVFAPAPLPRTLTWRACASQSAAQGVRHVWTGPYSTLNPPLGAPALALTLLWLDCAGAG